MSVAGVNSALQRARGTLADKRVPTYEPLSEEKERMLALYVEASLARLRGRGSTSFPLR